VGEWAPGPAAWPSGRPPSCAVGRCGRRPPAVQLLRPLLAPERGRPPAPQAVELVWETLEPYQSTIQVVTGEDVTIRGLSVRHSSKSVANNYAVFLQVGGRAGRKGGRGWGGGLGHHTHTPLVSRQPNSPQGGRPRRLALRSCWTAASAARAARG
jgi:hypothetical protein